MFGRFFFLTRELINIDYALLGAIWLWLPSPLRVALFAIVFILDAVTATGSMYNIHPFGGVIALLKAPIGLIVVGRVQLMKDFEIDAIEVREAVFGRQPQIAVRRLCTNGVLRQTVFIGPDVNLVLTERFGWGLRCEKRDRLKVKQQPCEKDTQHKALAFTGIRDHPPRQNISMLFADQAIFRQRTESRP